MRRRRQAVFKWNVFNVVCIVIFSSSLHLVNYLRLWKGVKNRPAITFIIQSTNVEVRNSLIPAEFNTIMCHEKYDTYKYPSSRSNRIAMLLMSNVVLNRSNIQFEVLKETWNWSDKIIKFLLERRLFELFKLFVILTGFIFTLNWQWKSNLNKIVIS